MTTRRDRVLAAASDLATQFLYYDRKEDEDLPIDAIEAAVAAGEVTVDELVDAFRSSLGFGDDSSGVERAAGRADALEEHVRALEARERDRATAVAELLELPPGYALETVDGPGWLRWRVVPVDDDPPASARPRPASVAPTHDVALAAYVAVRVPVGASLGAVASALADVLVGPRDLEVATEHGGVVEVEVDVLSGVGAVLSTASTGASRPVNEEAT